MNVFLKCLTVLLFAANAFAEDPPSVHYEKLGNEILRIRINKASVDLHIEGLPDEESNYPVFKSYPCDGKVFFVKSWRRWSEIYLLECKDDQTIAVTRLEKDLAETEARLHDSMRDFFGRKDIKPQYMRVISIKNNEIYLGYSYSSNEGDAYEAKLKVLVDENGKLILKSLSMERGD